METNNNFGSLVRHKGFLNLWINQILVQISYNSLNFALIIWVFKLTGSNTAVSALLFMVYLPAVLFGLFAGVLVDLTDRKKIIIAINLILAVSFLLLLPLKVSYLAILAIAFIVNSLAQLYVPAESSAIPLIAKKEQLLAANSVFSTTLYASFLVGFGLAGPMISQFGIDFVFGGGALLLASAFLLSFRFPSITNKADLEGELIREAAKQKDLKTIYKGALIEIRRTFKLIRGRLPVLSAIIILGGVQVVIGVLAVLIPAFLERVLQIKATDASLILIIPLGLGMVCGGFAVGKMGNLLARRKIVGGAILLAGLLLFSVGLAPLISPVISYFPQRPLPFFYQPPLSAVLAVGSFLLGIALVSIIIPTQTVLQESTPEETRGKVFSFLNVAMAGLSLIPVLISGVLADVFGALPIFLALGGGTILLGLLAIKPDFFFDEKHLPYTLREFLGLGHWEKDVS